MKRGILIAAAVVPFFLLLIGCAGKPSGGAQGFDWPQWRGPDGNGVSRETDWDPTAIAGGPRILWRADVGMGYSNVAIKDNRLYTAGYDARNMKYVVWCLDAASGRVVWKCEAPTSSRINAPQATPAVDGGELFWLSYEGLLECLDARSGKVRWRKDLVSDCGAVRPFYGFAGSPVVVGPLVIVTANSSGMAFERKTGRLAWGSDPPPKELATAEASTDTGTKYSTPIVLMKGEGGSVIIAGWEGLWAVSVKSGERLWLYPWGRFGGNDVCDPVVANRGTVFTFAMRDATQGEAVLFRPRSEQPEVVWRTGFGIYDLTSTPVIVGALMYGADNGAKMRCIDLASGRLVGKAEPADSGSSACLTVTAAGGKLIVLSGSGTLYIGEATPDGFKELSRCSLYGDERKPARFWTAPVLCNARIYCRNFTGDLVCVDVSR